MGKKSNRITFYDPIKNTLTIERRYDDTIELLEGLLKCFGSSRVLEELDIDKDYKVSFNEILYVKQKSRERVPKRPKVVDGFDYTVKSHIKNDNNYISFNIYKRKKNDGLKFEFDSLIAGLTSVDDFIELAKVIKKAGIIEEVKVVSIEEPWLNLSVACGLLDMKKQVKANRISSGMAKTAKQLGRPVDEDKMENAISMYNSGNYTGSQIADQTGISRATLYRYLKKKGIK